MIIVCGMSRLTAQRKAIFDLVSSSGRHWDAEELARALAEAGESVGIATVYRGLAALEADNLIESIQFGNKKRYERADKAHHDHMVCTDCGRIDEFAHATIEALQRSVAEQKGFRLTGHQLVIFGLCRACVAAGEAG